MDTENSSLECTYCGQRGHWRPDCPEIAEMMRKPSRPRLRLGLIAVALFVVWFALILGLAMMTGCSFSARPVQPDMARVEPVAPEVAIDPVVQAKRDPSCEHARYLEDRLGDRLEADNKRRRHKEKERDELLETINALDDYTHTAACSYVWSRAWESQRAKVKP